MKNIWLWLFIIVGLLLAIYFGIGRGYLQQVFQSFQPTGQLNFSITDPGLGSSLSNDKKKVQATITPANDSTKRQNNGPQNITALNLTITKVEVHFATNEEISSQTATTTPTISPTEPIDHWQALHIKNPFTVDLVKLANTNSILSLGLTNLPAGKYTQVRLFLSTASATLASGAIVNLDMLGKDNVVKIIQPFTINPGKTTTLIVDFDAQHSVVKADGKYILKPVVAKIEEQH